MKERPILFSGPMVRAILDGRKTQTRRILKLQGTIPSGPFWDHAGYEPFHVVDGFWGFRRKGDPSNLAAAGSPAFLCRYGEPGDRLWVRETWSHTGTGVWTIADARHHRMDGKVIYRATDPEPLPGCWWPSIHMPREFSRILLVVVLVRVERLQDITEETARAEGVEPVQCTYTDGSGQGYLSWREGFRMLWKEINGPTSWDENPWVWVVEFKRAEVKP